MTTKAQTSKPLKVKVIKFSFPELWYKDFIGHEFTVESSTTRDYYVLFGKYLRGILCKDATIVN